MLSRIVTRLVVVVAALLGLVAGTQSTAGAQPPGYDFGPYRIVNVSTGGHLLPNDYGFNHNDNIWIWAWDAASNGDSWNLEDVGSGYYIIRNTDTGKCLTPSQFTYGAKTYVTQKTCGGGYEFQWYLDARPSNPRQVQIISRASQEAIRPYYDQPNQVVVMDSPSEADVNYWSLTRL
ncbi:RICIN domain-containing protein [Streptomyces sp. 6N223]|uniref:RICIN domain-containing protein n=1 Tax=Streptomyces sp. 6N223 TaxID=3457412 RepID=UPI003FD01607